MGLTIFFLGKQYFWEKIYMKTEVKGGGLFNVFTLHSQAYVNFEIQIKIRIQVVNKYIGQEPSGRNFNDLVLDPISKLFNCSILSFIVLLFLYYSLNVSISFSCSFNIPFMFHSFFHCFIVSLNTLNVPISFLFL